MEHNLSGQNSFSLDHLAMVDGQSFCSQFHSTTSDEDDFFNDIFQQAGSGLCSQAESDHNSSTVTVAADVDAVNNSSFNDNSGLHSSTRTSNLLNSQPKQSAVSAFTLSFDNSTIIPIMNESPNLNRTPPSPLSSSKRTRGNRNAKARSKSRSSSDAIHHIMAERKRRQDLTQKFIALAATIPNLKKIDKASVLFEAVNYVKRLEERVRDLENEEESRRSGGGRRRKVEGGEVCCCCRGGYEVVPEVEARVLENQVLIRIQCESRQDIMLEMAQLLESIHLSVLYCSSLPFGNSALSIIVVAQMKDKYSMKVNDLINYLRQQHVLKPHDLC